MTAVRRALQLFAATFVLAATSGAFAADDGAWTVSKSSGEVWFPSAGTQPASLKEAETLKPGDIVRTGSSGRVLLQRGEETISISPIRWSGYPARTRRDWRRPSCSRQACWILLEVEKRNVKHFEVETPYLAAVVKGTQFRVTGRRDEHQRRCGQGSGRGRRFQERSDRASDAGPACDDLRARQAGVSR